MDLIVLFTVSVLLGVLISYVSLKCIYSKEPKKVYIVQENSKWIDIKKNPIPEDLKISNLLLSQHILVSDGEDVQAMKLLFYNEQGELLFYESEKVITHWRHFPAAPNVN